MRDSQFKTKQVHTSHTGGSVQPRAPLVYFLYGGEGSSASAQTDRQMGGGVTPTHLQIIFHVANMAFLCQSSSCWEEESGKPCSAFMQFSSGF